MERLCNRLVRFIGGGIAGFLFLQSLFTICNIQRVTEKTFLWKIILLRR